MATQKELVEYLAVEARISKAAALRAVKGYAAFINEVLASDDHLTIHGFGTFYAKERGAHKGRNPRTGADIQIPEKRVAKMRFSKSFKV